MYLGLIISQNNQMLKINTTLFQFEIEQSSSTHFYVYELFHIDKICHLIAPSPQLEQVMTP